MRVPDYPAGSHCPNCNAVLSGPFCAECGQHAHHSARGVGALLHDGWETLTHVDGRMWHTLGALLFRPGQLTIEYFRDRRSSYIPPVRLYLIMSLLFFAVVGLGSDGNLAPVVNARPAQDGTTLSQACNEIDTSMPALTRVLKRSCLNTVANSGARLGAAMQRNVPRMMFIFLPLLALAMTALYWRPRRLYVQQLVFFLHTHAALYAAFFVVKLADLLGELVPAFAAVVGWLAAGSFIYAVWYIYRAMRRVYDQRRWKTLLKMTLLSAAYGICLAMLLALAVVFSAVTG
jgi:hypothetical protein